MPRGSASALPAWEAPIGYSDPKEEAALSSLIATVIGVATLSFRIRRPAPSRIAQQFSITTSGLWRAADIRRMSEAGEEPSRWRRFWKKIPGSVRKTLVLLVGLTLIVTGLLLIVLPGPFTIPLLIAGLVVMASEFAWAASMANGVKHHGGRLWEYFRSILTNGTSGESPKGHLGEPGDGRASDKALNAQDLPPGEVKEER